MSEVTFESHNLVGFDAAAIVAPPVVCAPIARHRVLHVINGEHYAGAERVQDLLALQLGDLGYDVGFVCLKPNHFDSLRRCQAAPLTNVPMRARFDLRAARRIAQLVRDGGYELIHTHSPRAALVGGVAAAMTRIPLVHHLHSPTARDTTHAWRDWLNAVVERYSLRRAAAVIAVSQSIGDYASHLGLDGQRIAVVANGVPTSPRLVERHAPRNTWTIGTVALFRPRKGLEVLLEAVARLRRDGLPVCLRAVGGFESHAYEASILALADKLKIAEVIQWRGFRQDVTAELKAMDLFVLPSLFGEGLPMVVLEAMAAGTPLIGTRVEGVPEVIRDGVDGLIVPPKDAVALADAIRCAIDGTVDVARLRTSAWQRQKDHFSDVSMASGVARVYESVLSKQAASHRTSKKPDITATHCTDKIAEPRRISILGVDISDTTKNSAIRLIDDLIQQRQRCHSIYLVNAHTLNLATEDRALRDVLNGADYVFGDGTGIRWAARQRGYSLCDNLVGTDLVPELFAATAGRGYGYFLLGATEDTIARAAETARKRFGGWTLVGHHHGYVQNESAEAAIAAINASRADLLLVGMGNPLQEQWIARYRDRLRVPVAIGVGGLFDHWAGNIHRAPRWVCRYGCEWVQLMLQQPHKWRRYLLGNPKFLLRITRELASDRRRMRGSSLDA